MFLNVIVYGTIWPRVTLTIGVVLLIVTTPVSVGSTGMWLLNSWLEPGTPTASSTMRSWYAVPLLRAGTLGGGANSDVCISQ